MAADFLGPGQCDTIWAQHTPENRYRHKEKPVTLSPNPRVERRVRATTTQSRRRTARGRDNAVWDISQACSEMLPSPFDALKYVKMVCFPKKGLQASCPRQCHLPIHPFPKGSKELVIQSPGVTGHPAGWGGRYCCSLAMAQHPGMGRRLLCFGHSRWPDQSFFSIHHLLDTGPSPRSCPGSCPAPLVTPRALDVPVPKYTHGPLQQPLPLPG
jgi:hypothetical protein